MKKQIIFLLFAVLFIASCGEDNLPEDYIIIDSKILAAKIDPVEVTPGETVSMSLFLIGNEFDQNSDMPVEWQIAGDSELTMTSPYNVALQVPIPDDILNGESSLDLPVIASATLNGKRLMAEKKFRITTTPVGKNPEISGIDVRWISGDGEQVKSVGYGEDFNPGSAVNIACTAVTETLEENANETLVYRWSVTTETGTGREIKVNDTKDDIEALLGEGAKAAEHRESVVYDIGNLTGSFSVCLVVRDNAETASESSMDRFGTDYFYFTVTSE